MSFQFRVLHTAAVLALAATGAAAQTPAAAPAGPAPNKIAVVDIRQAIQSTGEGKQASGELQSQFSARQSELENLQKSIEDLQGRLTAGARTLSDEERVRMQRQGERQASQLKRKQEEFQEDANAAQQEIIDRIGRKMVEVVSRYARENSYSVILDTQTACGVYCSNQVDVTQEIIRLYDQANPVKPGSTSNPAPRPATNRPPVNRPPAAQPPATTPAKPKPPR